MKRVKINEKGGKKEKIWFMVPFFFFFEVKLKLSEEGFLSLKKMNFLILYK